jgi:hypothetical protein
MQIYYESLDAITQQTAQLDRLSCRHCGQTAQLISHGYIYKKQSLAHWQTGSVLQPLWA